MVVLNGFGVNVLGDGIWHFKRGDYHYYSVPNLAEYRIRLNNERRSRCDAEVSIDGAPIGTWRLEPFSTIEISRPANLNRRFMFVKEKSVDAHAGAITKDIRNGLVKVVFKPEKTSTMSGVYPQIFRERYLYNGTPLNEYADYACSNYQHSTGHTQNMYFSQTGQLGGTNSNGMQFKSGATVLGGGTDQYFSTAGPLNGIDIDNETTIYLRMVAPTNNSKHVSLRKAMLRPHRSTKIPPRIQDTLSYQMSERMFGHV